MPLITTRPVFRSSSWIAALRVLETPESAPSKLNVAFAGTAGGEGISMVVGSDGPGPGTAGATQLSVAKEMQTPTSTSATVLHGIIRLFMVTLGYIPASCGAIRHTTRERRTCPKGQSTERTTPQRFGIALPGRVLEFKTNRRTYPRVLMNTQVPALLPSAGLLLNFRLLPPRSPLGNRPARSDPSSGRGTNPSSSPYAGTWGAIRGLVRSLPTAMTYLAMRKAVRWHYAGVR